MIDQMKFKSHGAIHSSKLSCSMFSVLQMSSVSRIIVHYCSSACCDEESSVWLFHWTTSPEVLSNPFCTIGFMMRFSTFLSLNWTPSIILKPRAFGSLALGRDGYLWRNNISGCLRNFHFVLSWRCSESLNEFNFHLTLCFSLFTIILS